MRDEQGTTGTVSSEEELVLKKPAVSSGRSGSDPESRSNPPIDFDDWRLEDDLHQVERLIKASAGNGLTDSFSADVFSEDSNLRFNTPHLKTGGHHLGLRNKKNQQLRNTQKPSHRRGGFFSWCLLLIGITGFVCGAVLLGWSYASDRAGLWDLGIPILLVGQASLLIGLVMRMERISSNNRSASNQMDEVGRQLDDLKHTTELLNSGETKTSSAFYTHMAQGASPRLLLSDIKGQIDMLAARVDESDRG